MTKHTSVKTLPSTHHVSRTQHISVINRPRVLSVVFSSNSLIPQPHASSVENQIHPNIITALITGRSLGTTKAFISACVENV